jgi:carboxyl-terminal processing protease
MSSKKLQVWLPLLFALVMTAGMFLGYKLKEKTGSNAAFFSNSRRSSLQEVMELVNNRYVDEVKADSVKNVVIDEFLSRLDPHSVFIPAKDLSETNEELQGNFQGIGVEFQLFSDTVNVLNVIANGPSHKAGLMVGDKIIRVNDTVLLAGRKLNPDDIRAQLRGPAGSKVNVSFLRDGQLKKTTITRGTIPLPSVDVAYMIDPQTGFIRISKFAETTYEEFMQKLEQLQAKGLKKLIVDIRGNGGGFLNEAAQIADEFLDGDKLVTYTQGSKSPRLEYRCRREGLFEKGQLTVLVDETSASASEVLAGALQDWDRAAIVGRRTFGKGLVQQQFQLTDGSALRLTIARYYTPIGRNIQKPYNKGKDEYEKDLIQRFHNGELVVADTTKPVGKSYKTPGGRTVYGGGGITPDVFVPFDTTTLPKEIIQLYLNGTVSRFVFNYYIQNKQFFSSFKSPLELAQNFHPGEKEWNQIIQFAKTDGVQLSMVPAKAKTDFLERFKSLMARQIWRNEGYYEVNNLSDPMVKAAINSTMK